VPLTDEYISLSSKLNEKRFSNNAKDIRWEYLSAQLNLEYHNELSFKMIATALKKREWPKNLHLPDEGHLEFKLFQKLLKTVHEVCQDEVYFAVQTPPNTLWITDIEYDLIEMSYDEVLKYFDKYFIGYLYSDSKSWIIHTDTDLLFTIVGGDQRLVNRILYSDLEAIECTSDTRIDNKSDRLNNIS
jgi:hypothetical protein